LSEEKIVYSKRTGKRIPPCTVREINKPNLELMAKAFINLYYELKKSGKLESA
jgi:hypothetical protein